MKYINVEQVKIEIRKVMLERKASSADIARALGISPQNMNNLWNKRNFSFSDAQRILDVMGLDLHYDFVAPDKE